MARVSAALFVVGVAHAAGSRVHMSQHRMRVRGGARALMSETPLPPPPMPAPPPAPVPVKLPPVSEGANAAGLKTITLTHANGDSATLYTFGGCVTSYTHAGVETLKVRPDAKMDGSKPISGGIPHCFPQFGPGAIQQHGFARNLEWEVRSTDAGAEPSVCLRLADSPKTRDMWPYPFEAIYTVTLASDRYIRARACARASARRAQRTRWLGRGVACTRRGLYSATSSAPRPHPSSALCSAGDGRRVGERARRAAARARVGVRRHALCSLVHSARSSARRG